MDRQDEILFILGEVRADVKTLKESKSEYEAAVTKILDDHETRIRDSEKDRWTKAGIGGAIGAVVGAIAAFFGKG